MFHFWIFQQPLRFLVENCEGNKVYSVLMLYITLYPRWGFCFLYFFRLDAGWSFRLNFKLFLYLVCFFCLFTGDEGEYFKPDFWLSQEGISTFYDAKTKNPNIKVHKEKNWINPSSYFWSDRVRIPSVLSNWMDGWKPWFLLRLSGKEAEKVYFFSKTIGKNGIFDEQGALTITIYWCISLCTYITWRKCFFFLLLFRCCRFCNSVYRGLFLLL